VIEKGLENDKGRESGDFGESGRKLDGAFKKEKVKHEPEG